MRHLIVHLWWWFQYVSGTDNTSGRPYGFWSGLGGDIGELAIIGGLLGVFKKHNCHVKGCPRIGHGVPGTPYVACKKHNPAMHSGDITHLHIVKAHKEANK